MERARNVPRIDWAPDHDPWYRVGVWLVIYGGMVAAPALTVAGLLGLMGLAGLAPLTGEFYGLSAVGLVAGAAAAVGWYLVRRSRRDRRRLRQVDESYWL